LALTDALDAARDASLMEMVSERLETYLLETSVYAAPA